jgi:hypothetical protein
LLLIAASLSDLMDTLHEAVVGNRDPRPDSVHQFVLRNEHADFQDEVFQNGE